MLAWQRGKKGISKPGGDFVWLLFLWEMWWYLPPLHQKLSPCPVGEEGLMSALCAGRTWGRLVLGWKVHQPNSWACTMENRREGFVKCGAEQVNDCPGDTGQGSWTWGQQCSPAHPLLSPKNLLLPFQGDFGEDAISALPKTRVAVCLQNKALLFSNELSSKSFCPQTKTGMKDYMLAQFLAIPAWAAQCQILPSVSECPSWCHQGDGDRDRPFKQNSNEPLKHPISISLKGRAEPSPEGRSLWGGGTQSCTVHGSAQTSWLPWGSSLHPCAFSPGFYKSCLLYVIHTWKSCLL